MYKLLVIEFYSKSFREHLTEYVTTAAEFACYGDYNVTIVGHGRCWGFAASPIQLSRKR